jgi:hypothetical protein
MQALMPADMDGALTDYDLFDNLHFFYLWTITAQWSASVGFMILSIAAWRGQD